MKASLFSFQPHVHSYSGYLLTCLTHQLSSWALWQQEWRALSPMKGRDTIVETYTICMAMPCGENQEGPSSARDWETLKASVSISIFYCDQIPNRNSLREGRFIYLAHVSAGSSSWWEGTVEQSSSCHGSQELEESSAERGKGTLEHSQGLLLQLGSDSVLSWHLNNAIIVWIHQGINSSSRSVPSRWSLFPQILSLGNQAPSTQG